MIWKHLPPLHIYTDHTYLHWSACQHPIKQITQHKAACHCNLSDNMDPHLLHLHICTHTEHANICISVWEVMADCTCPVYNTLGTNDVFTRYYSFSLKKEKHTWTFRCKLPVTTQTVFFRREKYSSSKRTNDGIAFPLLSHTRQIH